MATKKKKKTVNNGPALSDERLIKERMRGIEKGACYCSDNFEEAGEGIVVVSRRHKGDRISFCAYLVDTYCLGLRRAFWEVRASEITLDNYLRQAGDIHQCDYNESHNWVYGAIAWAEDAGIEPCKEWRLAQYFLDEDTDDVPLMELPFGRDGKHFLFANNESELNRYLPLLRENLGDDFDFAIQDYDPDDEDPDDDFYDDDDKDYDPFVEWDKDYSYIHPAFPVELHLHHPELRELLLAHDKTWYITPDDAKRVLAMPHDELREDLEQLILHTLGLLYDGQLDDDDNEKANAIIENATLLLGEVGNNTTSLSTILETLKLSNRLFEQTFGDMLEQTTVPSICKLGYGNLDALYDFMLEQGFNSMHKCYVSEAVSEMVLQHPERRAEALEWYSRLLRQELKKDETAMVGLEGMGFVVSDLADIQAKELLEPLEQVFIHDLVGTDICGSYKSVKQDILHPKYLREPKDHNIYSRIEALNKFVERNIQAE